MINEKIFFSIHFLHVKSLSNRLYYNFGYIPYIKCLKCLFNFFYFKNLVIVLKEVLLITGFYIPSS